MKNILIVSSTKNSNYQLSNEIKGFFDYKKDISSSIISLEEFDLPLYNPGLEEKFIKTNSFPDDIESRFSSYENRLANLEKSFESLTALSKSN